jgi:hypothetical protein
MVIRENALMHERRVGPNPSIQIRLQGNLWSAVESFRRNEPDIPTRPEAVRRLVQRALDATLDPAICTKGLDHRSEPEERNQAAASPRTGQTQRTVSEGGR